ncbi:hypothetical protein RB595_008199 [Gaeumannomyces hyphopodioides]
MSGVRRSNSSGIGKLFLNGKYSDLVIRCQGTDFRVHRAIVCPQCAFLDAACSSGFREEYEGVIELPEDHPDVVQKLLEFLYTEDVSDPGFLESSPTTPGSRSSPRLGFQLAIAGLPANEHHHQEQQGSAGHHHHHQRRQHPTMGQRQHAGSHYAASDSSAPSSDAVESLYLYMRLYAIADKYDVPALADLAAGRWERVVRGGWHNVADWGADPRVADVLLELFDSTPPSWTVADISASTHEDRLRGLARDLVASCYPAARQNIRPIMMAHPELAVGVLDRVLGITDEPPDMGFLPP